MRMRKRMSQKKMKNNISAPKKEDALLVVRDIAAKLDLRQNLSERKN